MNQKQSEKGLQSILTQLKLKFGLLQHAKITADDLIETSIHNTPSPVREEKSDLEELHIVNAAIERKYEELKALPLNDRQEHACLEFIQSLEMRRLNLLTRIHGKYLTGYAQEPAPLPVR